MSQVAAGFPDVLPPLPRAPLPGPLPAGRCWFWLAEGWRLWRRAPGTLIVAVVAASLVGEALTSIPVVGFFAAHMEVTVLGACVLAFLDALGRDGHGRAANLLGVFGADRHLGVLAVAGFSAAIAGLQLLVAAAAFGADTFGLLRGHTPPIIHRPMFQAVFLLAGLIPTTLLMFAMPLVVLEKVPAWTAVKRSARFVLRSPRPFAVFCAVSLVFGLVGFACKGLPLLLLLGLLMAAIFSAYRDVRERL